MGWSLSLLRARDPDLIDRVLLATGKALYIANAFEAKCTYVLRIANLVAAVSNDPALSLDQAIATAPADKMLGATLRDLARTSLGANDPDPFPILEKARDARNYIAHEGADFGVLWAATEQGITEHVAKLRTAVLDLAAGDNIVSTWIYEIDEKQPAPDEMAANYPEMVDEWVFASLRNELGR